MTSIQTRRSKEAYTGLQKKDNMYLPNNKGSEFCVTYKTKYNDLALEHLNDKSTNAKVARMSAKTTEKKVNAVWKQICDTKSIPTHVQKSFIFTNTDLPEFYHLIKTHKLQQGMKIRPIVSNVRGPTQDLMATVEGPQTTS